MQTNEIKDLFKKTFSNLELTNIYQAIQSGDFSNLTGQSEEVINFLRSASPEKRNEIQTEVYEDNNITEELMESIKNGAIASNNEGDKDKVFDVIITSVNTEKKLPCIKKIKDITNLSLADSKKIYDAVVELQPKIAELKTPAEKNKFFAEHKANITLLTGQKKQDVSDEKIKEYAAEGLVVVLI